MGTSNQYKYNLLPNGDKGEVYLVLNFERFNLCITAVALFGFLFCLVWSILYNFEETTKTHCDVYNFLPSISAAIGSYTPQKHVWRFTIFLSAIPRFFLPILYFKYYKEILQRRVHKYAVVTTVLIYLELLALCGLTYWSSNDNYPLHKFCFLSFVTTSILYMMSVCILLQWYTQIPGTNLERFSLKVKWRLLATTLISFSIAAYCFVRHTNYCEPGVYSFFALGEYFVVFSNIAFHTTICWDFHGKTLIYDKYGIHVH